MSDVKNNTIKLLNFVKAFNDLKFRSRLNIKDFHKLFLSQVPQVDEYITVGTHCVDQQMECAYAADEREDVLLAVRYPEATRPPKIPSVLEKWISYNINDFKVEPSYYNSLAYSDMHKSGVEYFKENPDRVEAYEAYAKKWLNWKEQEIKKDTVRSIYIRLREMQSEMEATEATQELVVGNGILTQTGKDLFYPIVTQNVKICLDKKKNEVAVLCDTYGSKIESLALQQLSDIENIDVNKMGLQIISPMNCKDLYEALQQVAREITIRQTAAVRLRFADKIPGKSILFTMQPVFFIRPRTRAVGGLVDALKEEVENGGVAINDFFTQLLTNDAVANTAPIQEYSLEENLGRSCGESKEVLFTKPANKEQLEIAERIERCGVVVVQGPPGTGKTHTIANLMGNFLAEGKTVLVTSEKGKALSVLKNQLEKQLQPLCVYLNGENNEEAVRSVQKIQEYRTSHNEVFIQKQIEQLAKERVHEINEIAKCRRLIYQIRNKQVESIVYDGNTYSPLEAAQFVVNYIGRLDYIPGEVKAFNAFPLTDQDLKFLYASNEDVSAGDENHLQDGYPEPADLIKPDDFEELLHKKNEKRKEIKAWQDSLEKELQWDTGRRHIIDENGNILIENADSEAVHRLEDLLKKSPKEEFSSAWLEKVILDGIKGGAYQQLWDSLIEKITEANTYFESNCISLAPKNIQIDEKFYSLNNHIAILEEAAEKMDENGEFGLWDSIFGRKRKYEEVCALLSIENHALQSKTDCMAVLEWAKFMELAHAAGTLWDQMMEDDASVPPFSDFIKHFSNPVEPMMKKVPTMKSGLEYKNLYETLMDALKDAGFVFKNVIDYGEWDDNSATIKHEIDFLRNKLPLYLSFVKGSSAIDKIDKEIENVQRYLNTVSLQNKSWNQFAEDFSKGDASLYRTEYAELLQILRKEKIFLRRKSILAELREYAPGWSQAIRERKGIHGYTSVPDTIYDAWKWKQFEKKINEINSANAEELEASLTGASTAMRETTIALCEAKAWLHICNRINTNPELGKALAAWQLAIKKLGKGKSKNAALYRQYVQEAMGQCQKAIPVWIMPFYMTYDFLNPKENHFDVIIVDEASQSDVAAIATLQLADKAIVVGDDKQVSPTNMKIPTEEIEKLHAFSLGKDFPRNVAHAMDANSSLYDLALMQSQSILLTEHFRCVPEIIGYSNWLSYHGQIKALRSADSTSLRPAVISCCVEGQREGAKKINRKEAEYIVALLSVCCKNPAYAEQTFGVISLLGRDQADLINRLIVERIPLQEKEKHEIICGDAAQFQGDEKDVIFLSMVDSAKDGPLTFRSQDQSIYQQRYNVAVSRAKNQVWIVHSLHPKDDLKIQDNLYDIRRSLLEYAADPKAFTGDEGIERKADSPFEMEVCQFLSSHGFSYIQQYPAGSYRIDIAMQGKKVAIECDGDRWHSTEQQVANDMERQTILERLGWQFIRIRGTSFYRDKEGTMKQVLKRLEELEVFPQGIIETSAVDVVTESVKTEVEKLLMKWKNGDIDDFSIKEGIPAVPEKKPRDKGKKNVSLANGKLPLKNARTLAVHEDISTYGTDMSLFNGEGGKSLFSDTDRKKQGTDTAGAPLTLTKKPVYTGMIEVGRSKPSNPKSSPKAKGPITRTIEIKKKRSKK